MKNKKIHGRGLPARADAGFATTTEAIGLRVSSPGNSLKIHCIVKFEGKIALQREPSCRKPHKKQSNQCKRVFRDLPKRALQRIRKTRGRKKEASQCVSFSSQCLHRVGCPLRSYLKKRLVGARRSFSSPFFYLGLLVLAVDTKNHWKSSKTKTSYRNSNTKKYQKKSGRMM